MAIWTPIGLVQPTVLPFGQKNSGTEAQGPYRVASRDVKMVSNYVDDWLGYENDLVKLVDNFEHFLDVCLLNKITLNTSKTRFGYPTANFFGFEVGKFGSRLAQKHLNPLNNLIPPTTIPELRRVLGLFVVSRKYVKNFAMRTKPLSDLLRGQQPVFRWEKKHQDAYEDIRDLLLSGIHLAAPDYALPFHLATDASEDGRGAVLYQLQDISIDKQSLFSTRIHSPDNMAVIQFLSKSLGRKREE
jgi:hypothetical protein